MIFHEHFNLRDKHAFLSPSQYHWLRYSDEKLAERFLNAAAAADGVAKHHIASEMIKHRIKAASERKTLNMYVNDAIGYRMVPEQILYYSDNAFGTADAIGFHRNTLRIFDLKNGVTKASVDQLIVYAALFCLEYEQRPYELAYDLRLYQHNEKIKFETDPNDIAQAMDIIISHDRIINELKAEVSL